MVKGSQERFFVELVPDFDQKRRWRSLESQASDLGEHFRREVRRQVEVLGAPVAKSLYMESSGGEDLAPDLTEPARSGVKSQAYDTFRQDVKQRKMAANFYLEVRPDDVSFSVESQFVRVPYLGLVRHRSNRKILPSCERENASWIMQNVTSMSLAVRNRFLCLVIDSREDPSVKKAAPKRAPRKASKWLT